MKKIKINIIGLGGIALTFYLIGSIMQQMGTEYTSTIDITTLYSLMFYSCFYTFCGFAGWDYIEKEDNIEIKKIPEKRRVIKKGG